MRAFVLHHRDLEKVKTNVAGVLPLLLRASGGLPSKPPQPSLERQTPANYILLSGGGGGGPPTMPVEEQKSPKLKVDTFKPGAFRMQPGREA